MTIHRPLGLCVALAAGMMLGIGGGVAATSHKVSMAGSKYAPTAIQAKVGETISLVNDDFENHWVYVPTAGFEVSRAGLKPGESFDVALRRPGTFTVLCGLHTSMEATVTVSK